MSSSIRVSPHIRSVIDSAGAVLLDLKRGKYFSLSAVGVEIWRMLEAGLSTQEIEASLIRTYDAPPDVLQEDLSRFLECLRQAGIVDARD